MSDESPPPYSAVAATTLVEQPDSPDTTLPFSHSDRLTVNILALVSEGQILDSRFKDIRDVASAGAEFEYQQTAFILCQRFETLVWESKNIAGVALVAVKDFNENVLDFLSDPGVAVHDRPKELTNASNLLQRERDSAKNQKSSFDTLIKELEDFHQAIRSESGALIPKRQKQSHSGGRVIRGTRLSRKLKPPFVVPHCEPRNCISTVTASLGAISQTCMNYALKFEHIAEKAVFPSLIGPSPEMQETNPAQTTPPQRERLCSLIEHAEMEALPDVVGTLLRDLRTFANHVDVFNTIFTELAREQNIVVVYLKDGQSIVNQTYRSEINRLRRHLPSVCDALDAYSKGRRS